MHSGKVACFRELCWAGMDVVKAPSEGVKLPCDEYTLCYTLQEYGIKISNINILNTHCFLKIPRASSRAGSSPALGIL
jgi:hypothetical protein